MYASHQQQPSNGYPPFAGHGVANGVSLPQLGMPAARPLAPAPALAPGGPQRAPSASAAYGAPPHSLQPSQPRSRPSMPPIASSSTSSYPSHPIAIQPSPILTAPQDGGPPFAVPIHSAFTRVIPMEPGVPFPSLTSDEQQRVKGWMATDTAFEQAALQARNRKRQEVHENVEQLWKGQDWLGNVQEGNRRFRIRFDQDRSREMTRGKRGTQRREVKFSKEDLKKVAKIPELLIPIRLEYEHEAYKLRDTFTWNLRETIVTPEIFASHLCEDLRLPTHPFYKEIVAQVKRHIEEAHLTEEYVAYLGDDLAALRDENREWWDGRRKKRKLEGPKDVTLGDGEEDIVSEEAEGDEDEDAIVSIKDLERYDGPDEDLRVVIKLDITLDSIQLIDRFEWDLSDSRNSPESFAEVFAAELGLSGEFVTAIAHSIREQMDVFVRSLCLLGHVTGLPIQDDDLRREFLPSVSEAFRPDALDFTPLLNQLTPDEVERNDKEREREVRRKRRQTKGRGVTLPDRDPVKTHRTLVPKPSTVPIHSFQDSRGEMVYPMPELNLPYSIVRPVQTEKQPVLDESLDETSASRAKRIKQGESGAATPLDGIGGASPAPSALPAHLKKRGPPPVLFPAPEEVGLHEHIIDGKWYCANCGVPEALAVGRRKGPSGNNSLCGACGKHFHRYRKNRPCEYSIDFAFHESTTKAAQIAATVDAAAAAEAAAIGRSHDLRESSATQKRGPASNASAGGTKGANVKHHPPVLRESSEEPDSPGNGSDSSSASAPSRISAPSRGTSRGAIGRGNSPDLPYVDMDSPSSLSSESPPPSSFTAAPAPAPIPAQPPAPAVNEAPEPLPWMLVAAADLRAKQLDDRFEIIPRPRPPDPTLQEWRIRCLDCPGKLYNLGPGETLDNFSVHFKNRQHRANVEARLRGGAPGS